LDPSAGQAPDGEDSRRKEWRAPAAIDQQSPALKHLEEPNPIAPIRDAQNAESASRGSKPRHTVLRNGRKKRGPIMCAARAHRAQ
jgi:hypothetical protein